MRAHKLVLSTAAVLLVASAAGAGYAAGTLPRGSVGTVQLKTGAVTGAKIKAGAVTGAKVKDGSLGAADLSPAARAALRQRPTVSGFGSNPIFVGLSTSASVVVSLTTDGGQLVTTGPSRLVLTGAVTVGNGANTGASSKIGCQLEVDPGTGFAAIAPEMQAESLGNSNHDQTATITLAGGMDVPAGSYAVRITCRDRYTVGASTPVTRAAGLTAVATPL